jgi:cytoskeletal protein RodZ
MPEAGMDTRIEQENAQGVGALLRASRLRCGEDLQDVSRALRIRQTYLEAIESGRCQELPGPTYAIGFVRAYAEHLGLDSAEVVRRFKVESSAANGRSELVFPTPVTEAGIPGGAIVFVGVVVAVLAYGGWYLSTTKDGFFAELIAPVPERLTALLSRQDESTPAPVVDSAASGAATDPQGQRSPSSATAASLPDQSSSATEPASVKQAESVAVVPEPPAANLDAGSTSSSAATSTGVLPSPAATDASPATSGRAVDSSAAAPPTAPATTDRPSETPSAAVPVASDTVESREPAAPKVDETASTAPSASSQGASVDAPAAGQATEAAPTPPTMPAASEFAGLPDSPLPDDPPPATGESSGSTSPRAAAEPEPTTTRAPAAGTAVITDFDAPSTSAPAGQGAPAEPQLASRAEEPRSESSRPAAAESDSRILIKAKLNAWIQVRDDINNQLLLTRLLKPGDSYAVPDRPGLKLLTGNAGALEIQVDGAVAPSIGPVGAVRRAVALDAERLRAGTAVGE